MSDVNRRTWFGSIIAAIFGIAATSQAECDVPKLTQSPSEDSLYESNLMTIVRALPGRHLMIAVGPGVYATEVIKAFEVRSIKNGGYRYVRLSADQPAHIGVPSSYYFQILADKPGFFPISENGKIAWLRSRA